MRPWPHHLGIWSVVAAAGGAVVAAELRRRTLTPDAPALTAGIVNGPVFAALGALILHRRPGHLIGRLYLVTGLLLAAFTLADDQGAGTPWVLASWFSSWAWAVGPLLILTFGTLLLPDGERPVGRLGRWAWRSSVAAVAASVVVLPYDLEPTHPQLARYLPEIAPATYGSVFLGWVVVASAAVLSSLAAVVVRYHRSGPCDRQRLRWIAYCTVLAIALYIAGSWITLLPGVTWEHVMAAVVSTPAVGVSVAIVRHRMFDIDRLVARTLSYMIVTVAVVAIYLGAVLLASEAVPAAGDSDLVVAVSTLGAAAAFRPIRRRVQTVVDRRFHRSRYDAERLVGVFSARLRDEVDLATVAADLVATSSTSLRPASISLWTGTPPERGNGSGTLATYNGV